MAIYKKKLSETQNRFYYDNEDDTIMMQILAVQDEEVICTTQKTTAIPMDAVSSDEEEYNEVADEVSEFARVGTRPIKAP